MKSIIGSLNDSTPFVDNYVTQAVNPPADTGKYRIALVTKAVCTVTAVPLEHLHDNVTQAYASEVLFTCSKSTMPANEFYNGGVAPKEYQDIQDGLNGQFFSLKPDTKQMRTAFQVGVAPKAARITHHYSSRRMNANFNMDDHTWQSDTDPVEKDYLHVSYIPIRADQKLLPFPTRFTINIKYTVKFSEPGVLPNVGGTGGML
jgi:hypothetical protein